MAYSSPSPTTESNTVPAPVALVTGANKGIGWEIARQLGQKGLTVLAGSRSPERGATAVQALQQNGVVARFVEIDIADDVSVDQAARFIEAEYGQLDVLVNNAGLLVRRAALTVTADDMRAELETNTVGLVRVIHRMLPLLARSRDARVVNVSSDSASFAYTAEPGSMFAASHESFVYSATKAAVNMLTLKYAQAFKDDPVFAHVRINAVTPGYTATDLNGFRGTKTTAEGARAIVHWAAVDGNDAESGGFFDESGRVPW